MHIYDLRTKDTLSGYMEFSTKKCTYVGNFINGTLRGFVLEKIKTPVTRIEVELTYRCGIPVGRRKTTKYFKLTKVVTYLREGI